MPRPRFHKLSEEKKARILTVATEEFAESGFEGASYNRIIERAGLSKGAMYYYFDDKTDLYGTVVQVAFRELLDELQPPSAPDVEAFWQELVDAYLHFGGIAMQRPELLALMRGLLEHPERWREGPIAELMGEMRAFTEQMIEHGQRIGAVRTDLERSLLVTVAFSVGEAVDRWSFEHLDELVVAAPDEMPRQLVGLFRRLLEPRGEP